MKYYLEMYGVVLLNNNIENEKKKFIDSVEVEILSLDQKILGSTLSNEKGQCYFRLPLNEQYILKVSKKGLVTKLINVDTRINKEDFKKYNLPFEIEMYEEIKELEILLLKEPIAAIKYNLFINDFDYNHKYASETNEQIKKIYADYYSRNRNKNQTVTSEESKPEISLINVYEDSISTENKTLANNKKTETKITNDPIYYSKLDNQRESKLNASTNTKKQATNKIEYKVQIIAIEGYLPACADFFDKCGKADEYFHKGKFKYTLGVFTSYKSALTMLSYIKNLGYRDAFLVAFLNGERIELPK